MQTRPSFLIVAAGVGVNLFLILMVLSPVNEWWALPFPRALARYHLASAHWGLDLSGCAYPSFEYWRMLDQDSISTEAFRAVVQEADSAEGRLHALVGLLASNDSLYRAMRDSVARARPFDSVRVFPEYRRAVQVSVWRLLDSAGPALVAIYRDTVRRPEC